MDGSRFCISCYITSLGGGGFRISNLFIHIIFLIYLFRYFITIPQSSLSLSLSLSLINVKTISLGITKYFQLVSPPIASLSLSLINVKIISLRMTKYLQLIPPLIVIFLPHAVFFLYFLVTRRQGEEHL